MEQKEAKGDLEAQEYLMDKKKRVFLKWQIFLMFFILLGGLVAYGWSQKIIVGQFQKKMSRLSQEHVTITDALRKIQVSLYIYHDSIHKWLQSGDAKWEPVATDAKNVYLLEMGKLKSAVDADKIQGEAARESLEETLRRWRQEANKTALAPLLVAQTAGLVDTYFESVSKRLARSSGKRMARSRLFLDEEKRVLGVVYSGFAAINQSFFQRYLETLNRQIALLPKAQKKLDLSFAIGGGAVLLLYLILAIQVLSYVKGTQTRGELLVQMGTRDLVTGLLNRRVFEGLVGQEIERAKRRDYPVSLVFVRVDPIEQMTQDFGRPAVEHLLFQIAEFLRKVCRTYDGLFFATTGKFSRSSSQKPIRMTSMSLSSEFKKN